MATVPQFFTLALKCTAGIVGSFAAATAAIRSSTLHTRGSYSTCASCPSSCTFARETPFTESSADRTGTTQPSQVIPEIASLTLAVAAGVVGFSCGDLLRHVDAARALATNRKLRLVIAGADQESHIARSRTSCTHSARK